MKDIYFPPRYEQEAKSVKLIDVLGNGSNFEYQYDFGSTTALEIDVLNIRSGTKRKDIIEILARNILNLKCEVCDEESSWVSWGDDRFSYYFCDQCIEEYEGEYGSLPIVNSVCGYDGPAEEYKDIDRWNG